jgi:hypothetical protein
MGSAGIRCLWKSNTSIFNRFSVAEGATLLFLCQCWKIVSAGGFCEKRKRGKRANKAKVLFFIRSDFGVLNFAGLGIITKKDIF